MKNKINRPATKSSSTASSGFHTISDSRRRIQAALSASNSSLISKQTPGDSKAEYEADRFSEFCQTHLKDDIAISQLGQHREGLEAQQLESLTGTSLPSVNLHENEQTHKANELLGSKAFSYDNDIFIGRNAASMSKREQTKLITHELAHVIQQSKTEPTSSDSAPGFVGRRMRTPQSYQGADATAPSITSTQFKQIRCMGRAPDPVVQYPDFFGPESTEAMDQIAEATESINLVGDLTVVGTVIIIGTSSPAETLASGSHDVSLQAEALRGLPAIKRHLIEIIVVGLITQHGNQLSQQERQFWNRVLQY
jgi:hypothetical protein